MANDPELQQGPPPFMQAAITGAPPSAPGSPMGATSPFQQPQDGALSDYAKLAATQQQQILGSPPAQEEAAARKRMGELSEQASSMPIPKTGWLDTQGQPQQGGFLHTLGRALMAIGAATTPGQRIQEAQYGPGIQRYRDQQAALAEQIKAAEAQAGSAQQEVGTLGQVAGRTIMGGAQVTKGQLSKEATDARTKMLADKAVQGHQDNLARIAQMKDANEKNNAAKIEVQRMRDEMMTEITGMKDVTQEDVAGIMASSAQTLLNTKIAEDPSVAGAIKRAFGLGGAQAPGGAQPTAGAAPLPGRSSTPKTATPPRPKGVPADAKYDEKTDTWYK